MTTDTYQAWLRDLKVGDRVIVAYDQKAYASIVAEADNGYIHVKNRGAFWRCDGEAMNAADIRLFQPTPELEAKATQWQLAECLSGKIWDSPPSIPILQTIQKLIEEATHD